MLIRLPVQVNCAFFMVNLLAAIGFIIRNELNYLFNPTAMSVLYLGILLLEKYTSFQLKLYVRICLAIVLVSHTVFGEYYKLYETSTYFDKVLHLFGTFTFAIFIYSLIITWLRFRPSHRFISTFLIVTLIGISLGSLFENIEFAMDVVLNQINQRGLTDTDLDLLCNFVGSLIAAALMAKKEPLP